MVSRALVSSFSSTSSSWRCLPLLRRDDWWLLHRHSSSFRASSLASNERFQPRCISRGASGSSGPVHGRRSAVSIAVLSSAIGGSLSMWSWMPTSGGRRNHRSARTDRGFSGYPIENSSRRPCTTSHSSKGASPRRRRTTRAASASSVRRRSAALRLERGRRSRSTCRR